MFNLSAVIVSYPIDSLSFAIIASKCYSMTDPRIYGSGNPGAINALRSGKKKTVALTLLSNALKGVFAVAAARLPQDNLGLPDGVITIAVVAALAGYMWSVFSDFKGGKGVAIALGVFLALPWPTALIYAAVWLVMTFGLRMSSLVASTATVISPLTTHFFMPHGSWAVVTAIITALVPYRHKSSIENLL